MSEGSIIGVQWCKMFKDVKQMFTLKSEVVSQPSVVSDELVQNADKKKKKIVKEVTSRLQNFCVNFHKFHALFSMRFSQLG
jgi:hypothetical protein